MYFSRDNVIIVLNDRVIFIFYKETHTHTRTQLLHTILKKHITSQHKEPLHHSIKTIAFRMKNITLYHEKTLHRTFKINYYIAREKTYYIIHNLAWRIIQSWDFDKSTYCLKCSGIVGIMLQHCGYDAGRISFTTY